MPLEVDWTQAALAHVLDAAIRKKMKAAVELAATSGFNTTGKVFTYALIKSDIHNTTGQQHQVDPLGNHITVELSNADIGYTAHVYIVQPQKAGSAWQITNMTFSNPWNPIANDADAADAVDNEEF
ncbi:hypothetical protein H0H93_002823 [Arthromyces matolae]|nr:hypothetical protein H0H93_002823 [Arthromyces matolae]